MITTTIAGMKATHRFITDKCRGRGGAELDEALDSLRQEYLNCVESWPIGSGTTFHFVLTVEPTSRKEKQWTK